MPKHALFTEGNTGGKHRFMTEPGPGGQHAFFGYSPGFSDNFNRADGPLGSPWLFYGSGTWSVLSNQAALSAVGSTNSYGFAVVEAANTVDLQVDLAAMSQSSGYTGPVGLVWNFVDTSNYYKWEVNYNGSSVYRVVSGTANNISELSGPNNGVGNTGTYRITHSATGVITLFKDGSQRAISGASYVPVSGGTKVGMYAADTAGVARFDNVVALYP